MKYTWWILLTIAGILSLTSVYGFILCLGSFGMLAMNVMWLFVIHRIKILKHLNLYQNQR